MEIKKSVYNEIISRLKSDLRSINMDIRRNKIEINKLVNKQMVLKRSRLPLQKIINEQNMSMLTNRN